MKNIITPILFLLCCLNIACNTTPEEKEQNQIPAKVVAYVAGWNSIKADSIEAEKITHINYAFAVVKEGRVTSVNENDSINFKELQKLKARNSELKIIISVGGWGGSDGFSDAALSDSARKVFAQSGLDFIRRFQLDGIDLDWEYPGLPGAGNVYRAADKENFTLMLKELRVVLDQEEKATGKHLLLTIATGGMDEYFDHTELSKAHTYLDFINIMSYDLYHGWDSITGHHAGLYTGTKNVKKLSADYAVELHLRQQVPMHKLVLGIPFYGREWKGVQKSENGYNQPAKTGGNGIFFDTLYSSLINKNGYKRYWDKEAQAPYLWNETEGSFISYEDEESLGIKCEYVTQKGLGGVMFWEYSEDANGILLGVMYEKLLKKK